MIMGEDMYIGLPITEGNATKSTGWDGDYSQDVFGIGVPPTEGSAAKMMYPYARNSAVFGLGDGDSGCTCAPVNVKNMSMLFLGTLVAWRGVKMSPGKAGQKIFEIPVRLASALIAAYGAYDIVRGYMDRAAALVPLPPTHALPVTVSTSPSVSVPAGTQGLGYHRGYL